MYQALRPKLTSRRAFSVMTGADSGKDDDTSGKKSDGGGEEGLTKEELESEKRTEELFAEPKRM